MWQWLGIVGMETLEERVGHVDQRLYDLQVRLAKLQDAVAQEHIEIRTELATHSHDLVISTAIEERLDRLERQQRQQEVGVAQRQARRLRLKRRVRHRLAKIVKGKRR